MLPAEKAARWSDRPATWRVRAHEGGNRSCVRAAGSVRAASAGVA
jgi:hypothetical protein